MRFFSHLPLLAALASTIAPIAAQPQKQLARSPRIQSAKSVYLEDKTGVDAVGTRHWLSSKSGEDFRLFRTESRRTLFSCFPLTPTRAVTSTRTLFPITTGRLQFATYF